MILTLFRMRRLRDVPVSLPQAEGNERAVREPAELLIGVDFPGALAVRQIVHDALVGVDLVALPVLVQHVARDTDEQLQRLRLENPHVARSLLRLRDEIPGVAVAEAHVLSLPDIAVKEQLLMLAHGERNPHERHAVTHDHNRKLHDIAEQILIRRDAEVPLVNLRRRNIVSEDERRIADRPLHGFIDGRGQTPAHGLPAEPVVRVRRQIRAAERHRGKTKIQERIVAENKRLWSVREIEQVIARNRPNERNALKPLRHFLHEARNIQRHAVRQQLHRAKIRKGIEARTEFPDRIVQAHPGQIIHKRSDIGIAEKVKRRPRKPRCVQLIIAEDRLSCDEDPRENRAQPLTDAPHLLLRHARNIQVRVHCAALFSVTRNRLILCELLEILQPVNFNRNLMHGKSFPFRNRRFVF